ncbi:MAG TPA: asparagine synthase (glutamine-hydrolyzing) [Caulobacterales bacterium]|nr:asparagine synthase (glutamine-hydrolyzing) [Caulobacterales bacterium]
MCGIAGILRADGRRADVELAGRMGAALRHRGPDDSGVFSDGPVAFAHQRLSIIDLSAAGHQPMQTPDGRFTIVYNGEIYNYRQLRGELEREGWRFRSHSDTEVLLAGIALWGVDRLALRIDGMAALGLWDSRDRRLTLVRDRFGVKPLYVWRAPWGIAFASEIKAFLAHHDFKVQVNRDALAEYFTFQNLFRPHTLFAAVEQAPRGAILEFDAAGERVRQYWDYDFSKQVEIGFDDAVAQTRTLLVEAIERQLVSDVPVGSYLSGGIDSGAIVATASRSVPRIQTFTGGFEMSKVEGYEAGFDERRAAEIIAYTYGAEHYEQVLNAGDIRWALPRVIWHLEDLRLGMSYPNYYVARLASKFVKVCLSGAGGDELFAGYPWRYYRVFRSMDPEAYFHASYDYWQRLTKESERRKLLKGAGDEAGDEAMFEAFKSGFGDPTRLRFDTAADQIGNALTFECRTFLSSLLIVGDKLSMAHGLEERVPFLDNALVDFVQALPVGHKLADLEHMLTIDEDAVRKKLLAADQFGGGKHVLRQAMETFLPEETRVRPKQGFSSPEGSWYRGENAAYVKASLHNGELAMADYVDADFVRSSVNDHIEGRANNRLLIWSLLCFEQWCKTFLGGERIAV